MLTKKCKGEIKVDDISQMSSSTVSRIIFPRDEEDVKEILQSAYESKKRIGIRGTKHSMGGHSIPSNKNTAAAAAAAGWQIDTKFLQKVEYNPELFPNQVKCQPGATWADLISLLNKHGKAPRTMQSYCTFSVGGTLAVNAHGITTDYCLVESVLEMRLARVNTEGKAEIRTCRAQDNNTDRNSVESELFRSAIGGYGLFGIMTEVTLKVVDNVHLELDSMILSLQCQDMEEESEFVRIYDNCRGQDQHLLNGELSLGSTGLGAVEIKIARMNTINLEKASLYVFRKNSDASSVSDLPVAPRELTPTSRLLYKWLLPLAKEMRYSKEEKSGEALDWNQNDIMTKNHLLYESAVPMTTLYNPLVKKNDTFVLQEFFCPHDKFSEWIEKAKPIYKELEREQHKKEQEIILLNTTIRYVEKDDCTVLSYSRDEKGSFAFVLYFRIDIDEEVEKRLGVIHNKLAEITCSLGGTFYLPYRKCYSQELLKRAYPMIGDFAKLKEKYDPHTIFGNLFFDDYILPLCSEEYQAKWSLFHLMTDEGKSGLEKPGSIVNPKEFSSWLPRSNQSTLVRRNNSYRTLLRSKTMRDDFRQKFLVNIFHLVDPNEVMRAMTRFAWDPKNIDDIQIYKCLFKYFNSEERGAVSKVRQKLRALEQLNQQKNELTRQTVSILSKLGKLDSIHSYACFGDNGKTVQRFVKDLSIDGMIYVVHDADVDKENKSMPVLTTVLERGSLNSVADKHIKYDYISDNAALKLSCIPSGSIDLITMNQGLHHIPIEKLHGFLVEVNRILSPNGVFIIREHDLEVNGEDGKVPYAMLDLAHSVFNAVTGVPIAEEQIEIRAFRSISEWREVVEKVGFLDTRIYEVEDGDPTWDEMMAFVKNVDGDVVSPPLHEGQVHKTWSNEYPPMKELVATLLQQIPQSFLTTVMNLLDKINDCMPKIQNMISSKLLNGIPELIKEANLNPLVSKDIMKQIVNVIEPSASEIIRQIRLILEGARDMLAKAEPEEYFKVFKVGNEVFLLLPYLVQKVQMMKDSCSDVEIMVAEFVQSNLPILLPQKGRRDESQLRSGDDTFDKSVESKDEDTVSSKEVEEMLITLLQTIPGLLDPKELVAKSGFSLMQQTAIIGTLGATNVESTSKSLSAYLTPETWIEIKEHLSSVMDFGDLPTKTRLLSSKDDHPWYHVLRTFLRSPNVKLSQQAMRTLKFMGLEELLVMYECAKRDHDILHFSSSDQFTVQYLDECDRSVLALYKDWKADIVNKVITFDNDCHYCLHDVAEVIEAKFGYNSITSRKVDVTNELRGLHKSIHKSLSEKHINTTQTSDAKDYCHIGYLPLDEEHLVEMRNKGDAKKELGDSLRRSLVNVATLGAAGNNQLKLTYRKISIANQGLSHVNSTLDKGLIDNLGSLSESVCNLLEGKGIVRSDFHSLDGEWTWFKLNEWMQVEMLDELVKSLEHTAWFRFPFMAFLGTYFEVFERQTQIVKEKYGVATAYASEAFIVDFVPAIVMSMLFTQLQLLAFPLKMTMPKEGYDADPSRFLEEILFHITFNDKDATSDLNSYCKLNIHPKIVKATLLSNNFALICTPPFKAMGEILKKIAIQYPSARVFQISNQKEIQVRVSKCFLSNNDAKKEAELEFERLKSLAGCKVMMDFAWPSTYFNRERNENDTHDLSGQGKIFYCFEVKCLALLDLFRLCSMLDHFEVDQVFDFWN